MLNLLFIKKHNLFNFITDFITADVGGQLGLFCGASMITIIEIIEYIFTNFYWICILFLLKIPDITPGTLPPQDRLGKRNHVEEC